MNAWLRSPALLHVIAEHALRNAGSTELEIWYRDLCVISQSPGHLQGQERRRAQLHVTRGWPGRPSGCPYRVAEGEARKLPGAKGNSGHHPPCGIPGKGELACCLHWSPFLAVLGEIKGSHEGKVSFRGPCVAVSLWVGQREKHRLAFVVRRPHAC